MPDNPKKSTSITAAAAYDDLSARALFPEAPVLRDHFNDAATKTAEATTAQQGGNTAAAQGSTTQGGSASATSQSGEAERSAEAQGHTQDTPKAQMHLRPKDTQLVKAVHKKVAQTPDPSPW